jgi:hypothetical protein
MDEIPRNSVKQIGAPGDLEITEQAPIRGIHERAEQGSHRIDGGSDVRGVCSQFEARMAA